MGEVPRCLVVEPQPLVRLGMRRVLDDDGYEIEELTSREEAIDLVRDVGDFDVVVVDIRSRASGSTDELTGSETIHGCAGPSRRWGSSPTATAPSATSPPRRSLPGPAPTSAAAPAPRSCALPSPPQPSRSASSIPRCRSRAAAAG